MKLCSTLLILLLPPGILGAGPADSLLMKANKLYQEERYEEAVSAYESALEQGYHAAGLYYNLGNAYYKINNLPGAILNYERSLLLDPGDEDAMFNLEMANNYIIDRIEALPVPFFARWFHSLVRLLKPDLWATVSLFAFVACLFFFSLFLYLNRYAMRKFSFWLSMVMLFLSISSFVFSQQHRQMISKQNYAIVFAPSLTVKSSPDNSGTDLFVIHEGTKVKVEDEVGGWKKIKLLNGNVGWVPAETIEII